MTPIMLIARNLNVDGIRKYSNDYISVASIIGEMQTSD